MREYSMCGKMSDQMTAHAHLFHPILHVPCQACPPCTDPQADFSGTVGVLAGLQDGAVCSQS